MAGRGSFNGMLPVPTTLVRIEYQNSWTHAHEIRVMVEYTRSCDATRREYTKSCDYMTCVKLIKFNERFSVHPVTRRNEVEDAQRMSAHH
jgi:hypothetical protein